MVDNVIANPGVGGATLATDDIGGVHYPRVKVVWGADGAVNDTSAANPMPVVQTGALPAGNNNVGDVDIASIAAGDNNIGNVDVVTLPSLPAGANNIGDVDVLTLPAIPAGNNNIGDVDVASFAAGAITEVQGDVAHDAVAAGNPVLIGGVARTTDPTAVAAGDAASRMSDTLGKTVVLQGAVHDRHVDGKGTFTNTTAADIIAAAGVGVRIAVTSILVVNAHATVGTKVEIRDGTTVKIQQFAAAAGGGFSLNAGGTPLFITTANQAVTGRNVTTGADVDIFVSGYSISN